MTSSIKIVMLNVVKHLSVMHGSAAGGEQIFAIAQDDKLKTKFGAA